LGLNGRGGAAEARASDENRLSDGADEFQVSRHITMAGGNFKDFRMT
jgi:hypothetical protein